MGQDPRDIFRKLQQSLNSAQQKGAGGLPGGPRNFFGGAFGLILLGTGVVVANNALFNGNLIQSMQVKRFPLIGGSRWWSSGHQVHENRRGAERDIQRR